MQNTNQLEKKLDVEFENKNLLKQALTHRSYLNEVNKKKIKSNERLEFLGDAVLELWVTKKLFDNFPDLSEGILTNIRSALVCTESLNHQAQKINLGKYLLLSKGEEKTGGRQNPSLLADTFEAIIGAIYLDQGWKNTDVFLKDKFYLKLKKLGEKGDLKDAKTLFQEIVQEKTKITPEYKVLAEHGPDHEKIFTAGVFLDNKEISQGKGKSKRQAEEAAAKKALTKIRKKGTI